MIKVYKRKFKIQVPDPTARGGIAELEFDPTFDRVPSTKEPVNTKQLAYKYADEVCKRSSV